MTTVEPVTGWMLPTHEPSSRVFVGRLWLRRFGRHSGSCRRSCRTASRCCRRASDLCQCQLGPYPIVSADPLTGCNSRHVPEALASPETCTHQTRPNNTNSCAIRTIAGPTMSCMSRVVCRTALGCHVNRGGVPLCVTPYNKAPPGSFCTRNVKRIGTSGLQRPGLVPGSRT